MARLGELIRHELRADQSFRAFTLRYHRWMIARATLLGGACLTVAALAVMAATGQVLPNLWLLGSAAILASAAFGLRFEFAKVAAVPAYFGIYALLVAVGTLFSAAVYPNPLHIWLFALMLPAVGTPLLLPLGARVVSALYLGPVFYLSFTQVRGPLDPTDLPPLLGAYLVSAGASIVAGELLRRVAEANWEQAQQAVRFVAELEERVAERTARLEELSVKLMKTREDERVALARDLHDQMSQQLTAIRQFLFAARSSEDSEASMRQAESIIDELHRDVRDKVSFLGGVPLADDPAEGFLDLCGRFEDASGIVTRLSFPDAAPSRAICQVMLAVLREALTNVQRHALQATEVKVTVQLTQQMATLLVEDDGHRSAPVDREAAGPSTEPRHEGLGVLGMKARVRQVGGTFSLTHRPGGAQVRASIPLAASAETP